MAVVHEGGPLLIVAGAGTGKTTVITERISYLINSGKCAPEEILALTFTDKSANEMEERLDRLLPMGYVDLYVSTFHSFAERILKDNALEIGLSNDFKLLSTTEQWLLIRKNLNRFELDYYKPLGTPTKFIHALIKLFSRAKDEGISAQDYLEYYESLKAVTDKKELASRLFGSDYDGIKESDLSEVIAEEMKKQGEIARAYLTYQALLLENEVLDFGDLINYLLKLFRERKSVLIKYQKQFKFIMVDEFQDTNYAQFELVKMLSDLNRNIVVVGDDDQAIYKFRGASISNIMQFKKFYPEAKEIFLIHNYRSAQNILDLSYDFIKQNDPYRLEVQLAKDNGSKLTKKLISQVEEPGEILHLHGGSLEDEVNMTMEKIISLYNLSEETAWSDFAILVRSNAAANDFIYACESAKIPYQFLANRGLYSKPIVLDLLAYLKLLDNYHESPALYRVLNFPFWRFSAGDLVNLGSFSKRKGWSLYEALAKLDEIEGMSNDAKAISEKILAMIARHSEMVKENNKVTEIAYDFMIKSGYLEILSRTETVGNRKSISYLNQLLKKIQKWEKDKSSNYLKDFAELIDLELQAGEEGSLSINEDDGPDMVKIMTIHSAKGLEFKYVFVVNMVDKRFPSISKSDPIQLPTSLIKEIVPEGDIHLQEERRLFYVAMTRAKRGLYLTSAEDYGGARRKKLSRFLTELSGLGLPLEKASNVAEPIVKPVDKPVKENLSAYLPSKFSFTQLKAFETCPYQYRFAHILKISASGKAQFSFGKTMHNVFQQYIQLMIHKEKNGEEAPGLEELKEIYEKLFIDDWFGDRVNYEKYFNKGLELLVPFYEKLKTEKPKVHLMEYDFNLKLGEQYSIKGRIDRIDRVGEKIKIVDYKTGRPKDKLSFEDKEQLFLYQIAAEEVMKEAVFELAFYYIEGGYELAFLGTEKELTKVKQKSIDTIEAIRRGEFPPAPGEMCRYCDYNSICEYRD